MLLVGFSAQVKRNKVGLEYLENVLNGGDVKPQDYIQEKLSRITKRK